MKNEYDFSDAELVIPYNDGKSAKVEYSGPLDPIRDKKIISTMKKQGYKWYASGFNFETGMRDICFDRV